MLQYIKDWILRRNFVVIARGISYRAGVDRGMALAKATITTVTPGGENFWADKTGALHKLPAGPYIGYDVLEISTPKGGVLQRVLPTKTKKSAKKKRTPT